MASVAREKKQKQVYEGLGAGGKFRKTPFRRTTQATPYDRPPTTLRNPSAWLSKLVGRAQRLFFSVLRKCFRPPQLPWTGVYHVAKIKDKEEVAKGAGSTVDAYGGASSSQSVSEQSQQPSGSDQGASKRRFSVLDNDIASVCPICKICEKPNLLSSRGLSSPVSGTTSILGARVSSEAAQNLSSSMWKPLSLGEPKHKALTENGDNAVPSTCSSTVPSKSNLHTLRDKSPTKLSPSILRCQALKTTVSAASNSVVHPPQQKLAFKVEDKHEEAVASEEPELNVANSTLGEMSNIPNGNTRIKANSCRYKKRKGWEVSTSQSLAGAGTMWQSGVRRSTRIKTRPLEYWIGERLLYGRIHESMVTVVGIKCASPRKGDDGRAPLKVKSFVPDEHKEIVELAGLH